MTGITNYTELSRHDGDASPAGERDARAASASWGTIRDASECLAEGKCRESGSAPGQRLAGHRDGR